MTLYFATRKISEFLHCTEWNGWKWNDQEAIKLQKQTTYLKLKTKGINYYYYYYYYLHQTITYNLHKRNE